MIESNLPSISAILLSPDRASRLEKTLEHLRAQTIASQIEIVIAAPSREALVLDVIDLTVFHGFQVIEMRQNFTLGEAIVAAARQARAPIIVTCEDHSWPAPNWAEELLRGHEEPVAAVGPVFVNANPISLLSWADIFVNFGPWISPAPTAQVSALPGHNTSYKRDIFLDQIEGRTDLLEPEILFFDILRQNGYGLLLVGETFTAHVNFTSVRALTRKQLLAGRRYAGNRSQTWSSRKKLLYFCGSPLLPFLGLWRAQKEARRPGRYDGSIIGLIPGMFMGLCMHALGEMIGYGFGKGDSAMQLSRFELDTVQRN